MLCAGIDSFFTLLAVMRADSWALPFAFDSEIARNGEKRESLRHDLIEKPSDRQLINLRPTPRTKIPAAVAQGANPSYMDKNRGCQVDPGKQDRR